MKKLGFLMVVCTSAVVLFQVVVGQTNRNQDCSLEYTIQGASDKLRGFETRVNVVFCLCPYRRP